MKQDKLKIIPNRYLAKFMGRELLASVQWKVKTLARALCAQGTIKSHVSQANDVRNVQNLCAIEPNRLK